MPALLVIAKEPVPGRVKTRLTPPCTPEQAAALARAALEDTLAAALAVDREIRRVLVLDGEPGTWAPDGFELIAQRGEGLAERLAAAFEDAGEHGRVRRAQADAPVAAVERRAEGGVAELERLESGIEQLGRELRRVHADQERRPADVGERRREPLGQAVAALRDHLEAVRQPLAGAAVEGDHEPAGARGARRGVQRVLQGGRGQLGGLDRRARWAQAGLDPSGDRRFGDHDESGAHWRCSVPHARTDHSDPGVTVRDSSCRGSRARSRGRCR